MNIIINNRIYAIYFILQNTVNYKKYSLIMRIYLTATNFCNRILLINLIYNIYFTDCKDFRYEYIAALRR